MLEHPKTGRPLTIKIFQMQVAAYGTRGQGACLTLSFLLSGAPNAGGQNSLLGPNSVVQTIQAACLASPELLLQFSQAACLNGSVMSSAGVHQVQEDILMPLELLDGRVGGGQWSCARSHPMVCAFSPVILTCLCPRDGHPPPVIRIAGVEAEGRGPWDALPGALIPFVVIRPLDPRMAGMQATLLDI